MLRTFNARKSECNRLLATVDYVDNSHKALSFTNARRLLSDRAAYDEVSKATGVPSIWLMAINERESGGKLNTYLGNGQPLNRRTTLVPKGRGPFRDWPTGSEDAIHYDHIDQTPLDSGGWTWAWAMFLAENWNGLGPRMHGRRTGYLWSGTEHYNGGKYIADGEWDPSAHDEQLGVWCVMHAIATLAPDLSLADHPERAQYKIIPAIIPDVSGDHAPQTGQYTGVFWIQNALNLVSSAGLLVDGSYGRHTRAAVRLFQASHNLAVDGQAGPQTCAAIDAALAALPPVVKPVSPTPPPARNAPKGNPTMDFDAIIKIAKLVAPVAANALIPGAPLAPLALGALGAALDLEGPHTQESITSGIAQAGHGPDKVVAALQSVQRTLDAVQAAAPAAPVVAPVTAPAAPVSAPAAPVAAPVQLLFGKFMSNRLSGLLHAVTAAGAVMASNGLFDPTGPLAGMLKGWPIAGVALAVLSGLFNNYMIDQSNRATASSEK